MAQGLKIHNTVNGHATSNKVNTYQTKSGDEIIAPLSGTITEVGDDFLYLKYVSDCEILIKIEGLKPDVSKDDTVSEGDKIGTANGETKLKVYKPGSFGKSIENIAPYNSGNYCPSNKKSEEKSDKNKSSSSSDAESMGIISPYKVAALPFLAVQKGAKAITGMIPGLGGISKESEEERTNLLEDINRIKQLMK